MSVCLSRRKLQLSNLLVNPYMGTSYSKYGLDRSFHQTCSVMAQSYELGSNQLVLSALAALLVDCRFSCVWTSSTTISHESKSLSGHSIAARHRGSCSWIALQEFSKTVSSWSFPVSCEATSFWLSTMRESFRRVYSGGVQAFIRTLFRGPLRPSI